MRASYVSEKPLLNEIRKEYTYNNKNDRKREELCNRIKQIHRNIKCVMLTEGVEFQYNFIDT